MSTMTINLEDPENAALAAAICKALMTCDKKVKLAVADYILKETSSSRRADLLRALTNLELTAGEPYNMEQQRLAEHDQQVKRNRVEGIRDSRKARSKGNAGNEHAA